MEREKAGGLSFRPSLLGRVEKSQQNQDFCHCEEQRDVAISPLKNKEQKRGKIFALILSLVLLFVAIIGGSVFLILNHIKNTTATTESATLTTNLFNTDGTINKSAANELLTVVNYWGAENSTVKYTAHNIAGRTSDNSGSTIIFPMGYVNGTSGDPLYWQATYLSGGYLSIWLSKCYTTSTWNASSVTVSYDTYATSTIQAYIDDTFYPLVTQSSSTLKSIFATPKTAGYQTLKSGTTNDTTYYFNSNYTSEFNNMSTTIGNGSYMWLPSFGEVFNNTTSSYTSNTTTYIGQWGLNSTDRVFATSLYSSTSSTISYCWLRSGCSEYYGVYDRAMLVGSSGSAYSNGVTGSRGVRPAAHISLNELAAIASHTFDTNVFNTDGTINKEGTMALLDAVGYNPADTGTYTAHNIAGRTSDNSGSTIIFPMGYVDGTSGEPLYWKATYLHNNYLTIWLDKAYTSNIAWDSGDVNYTTYPSSTIQTYIDDTFWPLITQSNSTLQSIFATPTEVGYQLVGVGTQNDTSYYYSSSYTSTFDNMAYDTHFGSYMWLPSFGEVFNNTSSSYSSVNCTGLWGVNKTDRAFVTSLYKNSTSSTTSYCWLRSGYSNYSYYALYVFYTGSSCGAANAANGNGVRPAAHISLDVLANMFFKTISVESNNSAFGSVSGGGRYDNYTSATLTAIPNTGYAFEGWSLDGGNTIISTVNPYTFTVTKNETYTALFANTKIITLNINDSNLGIVRGGGKYSTNEIVELLAVPVSGCAFLYWIDSADPNTRISANPLNVTITEDKTYTAYFTDSLLNGVACVAEAGGEVRMNGYNDSDTSIHFSAVAYAGYTFDGWYIYGESTALSTAWSVDFEKSAINNKLIVAKFSETNAQVNTETNNTDKLT